MLVLWLAHLWARVVGERVEAGRPFDARPGAGIVALEVGIHHL